MRVTFNMRGMQMKDMLSTSLSNYTEAVKKANEVLKENNLKALRFGELNSCYKFLNRN